MIKTNEPSQFPPSSFNFHPLSLVPQAMPALKKLPINSTFFPGENTADDSHVENVRPTTGRRQPSGMDVNDNETQSPTRATTVFGVSAANHTACRS